MKDYILYIGRFSPPHLGHFNAIKECLTKAKKVIVCIGSANSARNIKAPWTAEERMGMIRAGLTTEENEKIYFQAIEDNLYKDNEWASTVRAATRAVLMQYHPGKPEKAKIAIATPLKDSTSEYLNLFPEWEKIPINIFEYDGIPLSATKIRELMFTGYTNFVSNAVPKEILQSLKQFNKTEEFNILKKEYEDGIKYEKLYENNPKGHTINFFCTDAIVIQSGHILLVRRKKSPGIGLYALPGGHVDSTESAFTSCIRELTEETKINIQKNVLKRCVIAEKLFDHPNRSLRARITKSNARTITMTYCFKLDDSKDLPMVKPDGEETDEAWWFPIETVLNTMRDKMFEDHFDIISWHVSRL